MTTDRADRQASAPEALEWVILGLPKTATTWLGGVLGASTKLTVFDESDKIEWLWSRHDGVSLLIAESATDPLFLGGIEQRPLALRALASRLRAHHYVLLLREPTDWVCSLYRQYLKRGGTLAFREFFGAGDDCIVHPDYANYERLVAEVRQAIDGPLVVCDYAHLKRQPRQFIESLCSAFQHGSLPAHLGESIPAEALLHQANVGLRGLSARIVRNVNRVRRTRRWNPHGWISWKRFERLPWHLLANIGSDVIEDDDRRWLENVMQDQNDWAAWANAFESRGIVVYE